MNYKHPKKTPNTPHYSWLEVKNIDFSIDYYNEMEFSAYLLYKKANRYKEIIQNLPMKYFLETFQETFPEATMSFKGHPVLCEWKQEPDELLKSMWKTDCDNSELGQSVPFYKYCPYCGRKIIYRI